MGCRQNQLPKSGVALPVGCSLLISVVVRVAAATHRLRPHPAPSASSAI